MESDVLERALLRLVVVIVGLQQLIQTPLGGSHEAGHLYVLIAGALAGAGLFLLRRQRLHVPVATPFFLLLGALLFGSALAAHYRYDALLAVALLGGGLVLLLLVAHLFRVLPSADVLLVDMLLVSGVAAAVLGLYQFNYYLHFGPTDRTLIPFVLPSGWLGRVSGPYGQPNMFALFLILGLLAFFYRYLHGENAFSSNLLRFLRFAPVTLIGLVFFLTQSRNGLIAFCLSFGILGYLVFKGRYLGDDSQTRRECYRLFLSLLAAFSCFWILARWNFNASGDIGHSILVTDRSLGGDQRLVSWTASLLMFLDHPWLGVGLDNFKYLLSSYQPAAHDLLGFVEYEAMDYTRWSHNELLQMLAEGGVLTFFLLLLLLICFVWVLWRRQLSKNASIRPFSLYSHLFLLPFLSQSMLSWPLRFPPLMGLFALCLGALLAHYPLREVSVSFGARRIFIGLFLAALGLAGFLGCQQMRIGSLLRAADSREQVEANVPELDALYQNPYSRPAILIKIVPKSLYYAIFSENDALARRLLPYAERMVRFQGTNTQWFKLAMLYLKTGDREQSRVSIERALALQPMNLQAWGLLHHLNVLDVSEKTGQTVESLYPEDGDELHIPLELPDDGTVFKRHKQGL